MNKMKPSQLDLVLRFFFFGAVPLMVGLMLLFHWWMGLRFGSDFETRAQIGDQFGALNALFTAVAFMGLVLTTAFQANATREQRRALVVQQETQEEANRLRRVALMMETRRMEMDIVLKRVDGAASEAEREAGLREAKEIAERAAGEVEARLGAVG